MPKLKNFRPHILTVIVVTSEEKGVQKIHNLSPGGSLDVSDKNFELSHDLKAKLESGSLGLVVAPVAEAPKPIPEFEKVPAPKVAVETK